MTNLPETTAIDHPPLTRLEERFCDRDDFPTPDPELPPISLPFEADDFGGFEDDPPSEECQRWWATWSPIFAESADFDPEDPEVEADRMSWLDHWGTLLPWRMYPGPNLWDDRKPCPDRDLIFTGLADSIRVVATVPTGEVGR